MTLQNGETGGNTCGLERRPFQVPRYPTEHGEVAIAEYSTKRSSKVATQTFQLVTMRRQYLARNSVTLKS